ncbi:recombinase A [Clostridium formicaceticum]|uniref:Protein RecA n=1 Tax=Clostridium formicaceticum TaxID=1497 RepID=A0AAC9WGC7_9CLOT|nr:recombinase A [Clostridium formicaceticum]
METFKYGLVTRIEKPTSVMRKGVWFLVDYASVRLDVRKIDVIKQGNDVMGNRTRVKVVKNKVAPPFRQAEFDIMYGEGISKYGDVLDVATNLEIVKKSGAWYSYGEHRLGQGRENAKQFLQENPDIYLEVENTIRKHYNLPLAKANPNNDVNEESQQNQEQEEEQK